MTTESETAQSEPTSTPPGDVLDLAAIAERHPVNEKTMRMDLTAFDAGKLTLLEVLDMSAVCGVEPTQLAVQLKSKAMTQTKARLLYALAWVIVRRELPDTKFSDVLTWKLDIQGKMETGVSTASKARARATVNAAKLAGVSPREAEAMTIAELDAYRASQPKRPAKRGRRR